MKDITNLLARLTIPEISPGWHLSVEAVGGLDRASTDQSLGVALLVRLGHSAASRQPAQLWRVKIPLSFQEVSDETYDSATVAIIRANLREWWDLKDSEPKVASWGSRIS